MNEPECRVSIALRLKRTTIEFAYVRVLVTDEVMKTDACGRVVTSEEGGASLDTDKLLSRGIEIAKLPSVEWYPESQSIEPHPIQKPLGADERYSN